MIPMSYYRHFATFVCCGILPLSAAFVTERTIMSPDGKNVFLLDRDDSTSQLAWSVMRGGRPVVTRGALGVDVTGFGIIADEGSVAVIDARTVDTTWTPPYGERATMPDRFQEETITLSHASHGTLTVKLQVRAYDEGVALRYLVSNGGTLTVTAEKTSFPVPSTTQVWVSTSAQSTISKVAIGSMGNGMERPLTAELESDLFAAFGEAGLRNHARMKFSRSGSSTLTPTLASSATYSGSFTTPWRYVRLGDSPAALAQGNHFMLNLNDPTEVADTSWIRPGKVLREVTLTTQGGMACVDYAAAHQLEHIMFDAGWYGPENNASSDATEVNVDPARSPGPLDLPAVIAYAKSKNVGVILYVNQIALTQQLDEILPLYRQWGVAGIKFGFVNVGSQQWTGWLHDAVKKCAEHQLMVNAHDEYRVTGVERTLPNFMTAEGIRGDEESAPNETVLRTIFTRCLAGPGDQTNCYFASRVDTMGSHASQLAKTLCIYSPWQYLFWYDRPLGSPGSSGAGGSVSVLQDVPEMSFFERLPTVWDETRWLQGHPDTHAVVARRKGTSWFIGGLNGTTAREFTIPLDFLPAGQNFRMELYRDDPSVATVTRVKVGTSVVNRGSSIQRTVGVRNGIAAILSPTNDPITAPDVDPPPPPPPAPPAGTILFETSQNYPAANAQIAGTNTNPNGATYDGTNGWSLSTSSTTANVLTTQNSGEYVGGQALGTSGGGTYVGGLRNVIRPAAARTISFDAQYYTGLTVGFMKDVDGDGLFEASESGMGFGVGGASTVRFQRRAASFGTETASPLAGSGGQWYRLVVTIGGSTGGSRAITMAVRNLTTSADLDFDTATAGVQPWSFNVTDADFGPAPETADGVFVRLTGAAKIDNLRVTTVGTPYEAWIDGYPGIEDAGMSASADPDHDGAANLLEFVFGGDPRVPDRTVSPQTALTDGNLRFSFQRRDDSEGQVALVLQYASDLGAPGPWQEVVIGAGEGGAGEVTWIVDERATEPDLVTVSIPANGRPRLFARLKANESLP
jgi:alpha-glucosidase